MLVSSLPRLLEAADDDPMYELLPERVEKELLPERVEKEVLPERVEKELLRLVACEEKDELLSSSVLPVTPELLLEPEKLDPRDEKEFERDVPEKLELRELKELLLRLLKVLSSSSSV